MSGKFSGNMLGGELSQIRGIRDRKLSSELVTYNVGTDETLERIDVIFSSNYYGCLSVMTLLGEERQLSVTLFYNFVLTVIYIFDVRLYIGLILKMETVCYVAEFSI